MKIKWNHFFGAVIIAGITLISFGAPPLAVAAGIGGAALWTVRASRAA